MPYDCRLLRAEPCAIVVFGAGGDLARRKLLPALRALSRRRLLGRGTHVVGVGRRDLRGVVPYSVRGDVSRPELYDELKGLLCRLARHKGTRGNALFYLALPPHLFATVAARLREGGLAEGCVRGGWTRLIVEKPFGRDLASARALGRGLLGVLREEQVYRIDHFLAKDMVQDLLVLRYGNALFEPAWERRSIDHVQVSVLERQGVGGRGAFYEDAGVVRDMFQNHLIQVLSLVLMEEPRRLEAGPIRTEKLKVLEKLEVRKAIFGQYEGYRREPGVRPGSRVATHAAMELSCSLPRWRGVPLYLRSGKGLDQDLSEVRVVFKGGADRLLFRIQPRAGLSLSVTVKRPGPRACVERRELVLSGSGAFRGRRPEAYELLLLDCLAGDRTLFVGQESVEAAWRVFEPVLRRSGSPLRYPRGSSGPDEARRLLELSGRAWGRP